MKIKSRGYSRVLNDYHCDYVWTVILHLDGDISLGKNQTSSRVVSSLLCGKSQSWRGVYGHGGVVL